VAELEQGPGVARIEIDGPLEMFDRLGALALTSTDGMVRRLGTKRWQRLHQAIYLIAVLALIHYFQQTKADVEERVKRLLSAKGSRSVDSFHKELGLLMWEKCGMARSADGLKNAINAVRALREKYWREVRVLGNGDEPNQVLEKADRVADFFELAELMCVDALGREESCGGHFRVEHQTPEGEAKRNDDEFLYVAAWEYAGDAPKLHKEPLVYEEVKLATRSYK